MDISTVSSAHLALTQQIQSGQTLSRQNVDKSQQSFGEIFTKQIEQTNQLQYQADVEFENFIVGESQNIHNVMIAMEEASIALELTTQVRNKVVEAYQELKNMQI